MRNKSADPIHGDATVKSSTHKILTTHIGSLPDPEGLDRTAPDYPQRLRNEVAAVVKRQRELGLDVINEGEYTKEGDWLTYIDARLGGFTQGPPKGGTPVLLQGKDREEFADFYRYAGERGTLRQAAIELRAIDHYRFDGGRGVVDGLARRGVEADGAERIENAVLGEPELLEGIRGEDAGAVHRPAAAGVFFDERDAEAGAA